MISPSIDSAKFVSSFDPEWGEALAKVRHDYFHLPGYLQASASHEGGESVAFLLEAQDYGMLVPLLKRPLACFGEAYAGFYDVTSPYGYPAPLYWGENWQACLSEMHEAFTAFLREQKVVSLFLRLNPFLGATAEQLASLGTLRLHGPTVYIDLRDAAGSWNGINSANRRSIAQMLNRGFEVQIDQWNTLDTVIEAYYETMRRLGASPFYFFPKEYFYNLVKDTVPHLHLATSHTPTGEISGGVLFTESHGLMHYYLTGVFEDYMDVSPGKLMINALRLWGIEQGHHTLHLGGGLGACKDGLFQFKARLSKSFATFSTIRKVLLPEIYQALAAERSSDGSEDPFFPIYRRPT